MVIKLAGNTAYVLSGDSRLLVVDLRDGGMRRADLLYRTDFVSSSAFDIALSADGNFLYVKHGSAIERLGIGQRHPGPVGRGSAASPPPRGRPPQRLLRRTGAVPVNG